MGMKLSSLTLADKLVATDGSGLNCALAATTAFLFISPFSKGPIYSDLNLLFVCLMMMTTMMMCMCV